jgi:hypothetical protein
MTDIFDLPMEDNDAGADTIGQYFKLLAIEVWREGEGFSGKRPFGNSCWESDVYRALAKSGVIESTTDQWGDIEISREEEGRADELIDKRFRKWLK